MPLRFDPRDDFAAIIADGDLTVDYTHNGETLQGIVQHEPNEDLGTQGNQFILFSMTSHQKGDRIQYRGEAFEISTPRRMQHDIWEYPLVCR